MLTRKIVILFDFKCKTQSIMFLNFFEIVKTSEYVHQLTFFIYEITLSQQIQNYFSIIFLQFLHLLETLSEFDDQT